MYSAFSHQQIFPLAISLCLLIPSLVLFLFHRYKLSILFLCLGAISLALFFANLDPFLNLWDEQFHALVAKNMMENPFKPMLYADPIIPYDYTNWVGNHIWVHKQPWFLWQISLSYKIFGITPFATRIPTAILFGLIPFFIYRMGKISLNQKAAFLGAFLFAFMYYPLQMIAGHHPTDHNDISFLFYICASFWAWFEYKRSGKFYWIILIGIFSGIAVLTKWLVGLLVFAAWFFSLLWKKKEIFHWKRYIPIAIAFIVCLVIFLPWQIYTDMEFPLETRYEKSVIKEHLHTPIEGHTGNSWFHIDNLFDLYGRAALVLIPGLIFLFKRMKNKEYLIAITSSVAIVFLFFTYIATKMPAFTLVVAPLLFLGIGAMFDSFFVYLEKQVKYKILVSTLFGIILLYTANAFLNLEKVEDLHTMKKPWLTNRTNELIELKAIQELPEKINENNYVLFNANITTLGLVPVMFHTNHIAYAHIPPEEHIQMVKDKGLEVVIWDLGNLPEEIYLRDDVIILPAVRED
jgi:4-amino-4-deoxy-L-arabinose transferase-like glycosyltransferase